MIKKLKELTEVQQRKVFEQEQEDLLVVDFSFTLDELREHLESLGLFIDKIYFDLSHSQGSGACFTGDYRYEKNWKKTINSFGFDTEKSYYKGLIALGELFQSVQRPYFYQLKAEITHRSRNVHENSMTVSVYDRRSSGSWTIGGDAESGLEQAVRETAQFIYKTLETVYEYETSFEVFLELQEENEFEIDEEEIGE